MPDSKLDRWVQRVSLLAMLALAAALVATGVALYAPSAGGSGGAVVRTR